MQAALPEKAADIGRKFQTIPMPPLAEYDGSNPLVLAAKTLIAGDSRKQFQQLVTVRRPLPWRKSL